MDGLLFPIIMLAITLIGGGILLLYLRTGNKKIEINEEDRSIQTAQEFINVKDVRDKYLYTKDGLILVFLRVHAISIDLFSKAEKNSLIRQLTAELSEIQYPFKFMAVSRPVDISPLIHDLQSMLKTADDKRKELLRQEILQMSGFALSGEITERQFYISIWEKSEEENGTDYGGNNTVEKDIYKRASLLAEKFTGNGIGCDILPEKEIVRLLNLVHNPSYAHLEDMEYEAGIPLIKEDFLN